MKIGSIENPIFESLIDSAHRYQNGPEFMIKEEDMGKKIKVDDIKKYMDQILSMFNSNVITAITSYPFGDIKGELLKNCYETLVTLKDNQSLTSLIEGLKKVFNQASQKVASSKNADKVKAIWDALKSGIDFLIKAYTTLATRAGSQMGDATILAHINQKMTEFVDELKKAIDESKKITVSAKK
jgi:hypothetical protein